MLFLDLSKQISKSRNRRKRWIWGHFLNVLFRVACARLLIWVYCISMFTKSHHRPAASCDLSPLGGGRLTHSKHAKTRRQAAHSLCRSAIRCVSAKCFFWRGLTNGKPETRQWECLNCGLSNISSLLNKIQRPAGNAERPPSTVLFQPFGHHIASLKTSHPLRRLTLTITGAPDRHLNLHFILSFKWNATQEYTKNIRETYLLKFHS